MSDECNTQVPAQPDETIRCTVSSTHETYAAAADWVADKIAQRGDRPPESLRIHIEEHVAGERDELLEYDASVHMHATNWVNPAIETELVIAVVFARPGTDPSEVALSIGSGPKVCSGLVDWYAEEVLHAQAGAILKIRLADGIVVAEPEILATKVTPPNLRSFLLPVVNGAPYAPRPIHTVELAKTAALTILTEFSHARNVQVYLLRETSGVPMFDLVVGAV